MFRGEYKFKVRYVDSQGLSHGGYIQRSLKKTLHAFVGGKERFIKQRSYPITRHHD